MATILISDDHLPGIDAPVFVRVSSRAKYARLNISRRGLEVVVPRRFSQRRIDKLLHEQRDWIDKAVAQVRRQFGEFSGLSVPPLPTSMALRAMGACLTIHCTAGSMDKAHLRGEGDTLFIDYPVSAEHTVFDILRRYLKQRARPFFSQQLTRLSASTRLPYSKLCVRGQRTRWGSYSHAGTVNLNYKLLFLPPELVEHVLLHELCHARYMDHSAGFWALLESFDPATETRRQALREADCFIPGWAEFEG